MVHVKQTWSHCVNRMGKTQSKPLGTQHGVTWEQHGRCELGLTVIICVNSDGSNKQVPVVVGK
jgi:hypothetical protein